MEDGPGPPTNMRLLAVMTVFASTQMSVADAAEWANPDDMKAGPA